MPFVESCLAVDVFKSLMVSMEYKFFVGQIVLPMFYCLYYGIEFHIIGAVVELGLIEFFTEIGHWLALLT